MRLTQVLSAASLSLLVLNGAAVSYTYPGHPYCPWNNLSHSWKGFFLNEYGVWGKGGPFFSIKFKKDIGSIAAGRCYTVNYNGNGSWTASGWNRIRNMTDNENGQVRAGADPHEYKINFWGAPLTFNEGGEVFLNKELVGNMYCHIGGECDK